MRAFTTVSGEGPSTRDPAWADWSVRPRYSAADLVTLLWREKWLMLTIFAVIFSLGAAYAFTQKKTYTANAALLIRLGQEYVYEPRAGDAGRGAVPDSDVVIQSETQILGSAQLRERVVEAIGPARLYPDLAATYGRNPTGAARQALVRKASETIQRNLSILTAPDMPTVRLAFRHDDPAMAAEFLNAFMAEYVVYRRTILGDVVTPLLEDQRRSFERRLTDADQAYAAFLTGNGIGDFATERQALAARYQSALDERYRVEADMRDVAGRLAAVNRDLGGVPAEIQQYRDANNTASDQLLTLQIQRQDLLSRYRPDAQPVRELDNRIAAIQRAITAGSVSGQGARRTGVNPVFQTLQTEQLQLQAQTASLQARHAQLLAQIEEITGRQQRLVELEPQFQDLSLQRETLQAAVRDFTVREQQSRAASDIASRTNDNVRVVERATPPVTGTSLKAILLVLSFGFAGFVALCAGLGRIFLRRGFATPASTARTLDLPVLATAPLKAA